MSIVEIADLTVTYRSGRRRAEPVVGLDRVSLSLEAGETLGVVGESGSGKSTLGRAIAGLERVDGGSLRVAGFEVDGFGGRVPGDFWGEVQMVWQDPLGSLTPTMKMGDTLAESYCRGRRRSASEIAHRLEELMAMVQLPMACLGRYAHELSGGQRQRIAIARAFAANPSVVVLDEAVSALDVLTQGQILQLLMDIQDAVGVTYIFISHDLGVVGRIADRTAVLYRGNLMEFGRTDQVVPEPENPYTRELMLSTLTVEPGESALEPSGASAVAASSPGRPQAPFAMRQSGPGLCPYLSRCVHAVEECTVAPAPVVELEPGHTSKCHVRVPSGHAQGAVQR